MGILKYIDKSLGERSCRGLGLLDVLLHHGPRQEVGRVLGQDQVGGPGEDVVGRRLLPGFPTNRPVLPVQVNGLPPALVLSDTEA